MGTDAIVEIVTQTWQQYGGEIANDVGTVLKDWKDRKKSAMFDKFDKSYFKSLLKGMKNMKHLNPKKKSLKVDDQRRVKLEDWSGAKSAKSEYDNLLDLELQTLRLKRRADRLRK